MSFIRFLITAGLLATLSACATTGGPETCPAGTQNLPDCPPLGAIADPFIDHLYAERTWVPADELKIDPIEVGKRAEIPIQRADVKFLGTTAEGALNSLAAKIWMIDNAQHTVDATYYIFKRDLVGESMLAALCNAVKRGVDVRFMVDSIGSLDPKHHGLKALETCAGGAGFMRNADGQLTTRKARVQVVIFNAISKLFVNMNRRSHDKLLIVDGNFPDRAMTMTGGRNISLAYYGIKADGSPDPDTYMDAEILLRTKQPKTSDEITVGEVSEAYFTLLFFFQNNHRLRPSRSILARKKYDGLRRTAQTRLSELKAIPVVKERLDAMPKYMARGWTESRNTWPAAGRNRGCCSRTNSGISPTGMSSRIRSRTSSGTPIRSSISWPPSPTRNPRTHASCRRTCSPPNSMIPTATRSSTVREMSIAGSKRTHSAPSRSSPIPC
ncbi:MAG: hypothetical protein JRG90_13565 [Deltaproteobacteria bacterium]|nr:hypothetical protein [Deltaproteobacteria bacterium]